jgi:beta-1,4-mannosyl-glycoprotein beta-1,4-N-acetylglucosaminyltransferase
MRIFDGFCFFNELDILEIRLNTLDPYVDYFIIVESSLTHTGNPKPYYFEENKGRFESFLPKIIHLKIEDTPNNFSDLSVDLDSSNFDSIEINKIRGFIKNQSCFNINHEIHYGRDFYQKECVRRGFEFCEDEDIIIFSDCDEIPNPEIIKSLKTFYNPDLFYDFLQTTYYYYLNVLKEKNWRGSSMGSFKRLKEFSLNQLRAQKNQEIENGGWHFSFMGGAEKVRDKVTSYSAQEMINPHVLQSIENNINNNIDPFFRGNLSIGEIDSSYPKYITENLDKFESMIKK